MVEKVRVKYITTLEEFEELTHDPGDIDVLVLIPTNTVVCFSELGDKHVSGLPLLRRVDRRQGECLEEC